MTGSWYSESDQTRAESADIDQVPISARAAAASLSLGPPRLSLDGTKVCYSSSASGGNALFVSPVQSPLERLATPFSVKSGYFGFGGYYSFSTDGSSVFVVESTGDLKLVDLNSGSSCTIYSGGAISDLEPSPDGSKIAFVADQASILVADIDGDDIEVSLVADLSHVRSGYKSPDFFASPKFSPDGIYLTWSEWSFPDMAWDASRMVVVRAAGPKYPPQLVVGSPEGAFSVTQPKFSPDGSDLYFISDQSGFCIPWRMSVSTGVTQPVFELEVDCAEADLSPGQSSYAICDEGVLVATNENGFGTISLLDPKKGRETIQRGVFGGLDVRNGVVVAQRSGARTPNSIVVIDIAEKKSRAIKVASAIWVATKSAVEPEVLEVPHKFVELAKSRVPEKVIELDEREFSIPFRLYRPKSKPSGLILSLHGGPVGQNRVTANARYEYFLDRGFQILVPDFRGTTGHGRRFTQAIYANFGVVDVIDSIAALYWAQAEGISVASNSIAMGGSSAGLTVLAILRAAKDLIAGGVVLYPVTDIVRLAESTHRLEERYFDKLVGRLPDQLATYIERSPVTWASEITSSLLVFQGTDDPVVPDHLTDDFVSLVGGNCKYIKYQGQGHGWSDPSIIEDELVNIERFILSVFG